MKNHTILKLSYSGGWWRDEKYPQLKHKAGNLRSARNFICVWAHSFANAKLHDMTAWQIPVLAFQNIIALPVSSFHFQSYVIIKEEQRNN